MPEPPPDPPKPEPRRTELRRLLGRPDAAPRVRRAVARLLGVSVISIGAVGALAIWHLVRRGRLIRERLVPPRAVRLQDPRPRADPEERDPPR
ncbi:MAG: hypothetical protein LC745_08555 [Planctomycetia bacterium]|nr:hypothetical protein [Planctomycetia bacterium]